MQPRSRPALLAPLLALAAGCGSAPPTPAPPPPLAATTRADAAPTPAAPPSGKPSVVLQTAYDRSTSTVEALTLSLDGKLIATGASWGRVKIWDAATGFQRARLERVSEIVIYGVHFGPDARTLAAPPSAASTSGTPPPAPLSASSP